MKFNLLSAILRINNLTFTKRDTVENLFFDEVITYFEGIDFGGMPTHFNGRSGVSYHFAYALPNHKGSPLVLLDIQNHISLGQVMQAAYAYNDLRNGTELAQQSSTSRYIIIYNEQNAGISTKAAQVADDSHLTLIPWADKVSIDRLKLA